MWIVIKEIDNKQHYRLNKRNAAKHYQLKKINKYGQVQTNSR